MGGLFGKSSRSVLSWQIKCSFLTTNYIYMLLPTATLHTFLHDLTPPPLNLIQGVQSLRSVSTSSTLNRLQQWHGSYPTYCRPTADGDGCSLNVVSFRLVDDDHTPWPLRGIASLSKCFLFLELPFSWVWMDNFIAFAFSASCSKLVVVVTLEACWHQFLIYGLSYLQPGTAYSCGVLEWHKLLQ